MATRSARLSDGCFDLDYMLFYSRLPFRIYNAHRPEFTTAILLFLPLSPPLDRPFAYFYHGTIPLHHSSQEAP